MIEDNPGDIRLVQNLLNKTTDPSINMYIANDLKQALKCIASEHISVILLDLNLPDSRGIDTFKAVKRFSLNRPIIIMSVVSDKELIYEALKSGAQSYLIKGQIENEALIREIRYSIWSTYEVY